jgi:hypothetical protein
MALLVGADQSGNANFWTPTNISISGATNDSMVDVPGIAAVSSRPDIGGVVRGNYCTLNPILRQYSSTDSTGSSQPSEQWADGNLRVFYKHDGVSGSVYGTQTIPNTGKWYFEYTDVYEPANAPVRYGQWVGIAPADTVAVQNGTYVGGASDYGYNYTSEGALWQAYSVTGISNSSNDAYANYGTGDVIGVAYDADAKTIRWYKNNTLIITLPNIYSSPAGYVPCAGGIKQNTGSGWNTSNIPAQGLFNFGATPFIYTPPTGYKSINTTNLPNPVIKRSNDHFDVKTWTGNGIALTVGNTQKQTSAVQIPNSLRFKDYANNVASSPTYLEYNPTTVTTSSYTWTFSVWIKRGRTNTSGYYPWIISADNNSGNADGLRFIATDEIDWIVGGSQTLKTNNRYQNTQQWNHYLFVWDTTNATPSERQKLYVNGTRVTSWAVSNFVSQNTQSKINLANYLHRIGTTATTGKSTLNSEIFDGHMAELNFIDNAAKSPTDFGQFDANNNWIPKTYTGSYGTSGYYLPFKAPTSFDSNSTYSVMFNENASQYLTVATSQGISNFGTGDFTVEGWFNFAYNPDYTGQLVSAGNGNNTGAYYWQYYGGQLQFGIQGTGLITGYSWTPSWGQWYYLAVTRSGSTVRQFVNGVLVSNATNSQNFIDGPTWIGNGGAGYFSGQMSNIRIIKGTAQYTSGFSIPTSALTAVTGTRLLTCQSSAINDQSGNNFTITNNNSIYSPVVDYPWAKGVFSDYSGNNNNVGGVNFATTAPTVLTYGTPGTYTWTAPAGVTSVDVLVVAGGGGSKAGGGGGGGVIYSTAFSVTPSTSYTVTVGAGGDRVNGGNSVFSSLTAIGGGFGADSTSVGSGGSGGGGYYGLRSDGLVFGPYGNGTGTTGQGFAGGNYSAPSPPPSSSYAVGAGGGGAGGQGFTNSNWTGGNGGPGRAIAITGATTYYAGGGGGQGGYAANGGIGGIGGGGSGSGNTGYSSQKGVDGTGGGGGGGYWIGGSGIVILKYTNANSYVGTGANNFLNQDNTIDTITDYTDTYGDHANYSTLDTNSGDGGTYSNGGLTWLSPATDQRIALSTINMANTNGKFYCEVTIGTKTATYWQLGVFGNATTWNPRLQYRSDGPCWIDGTQQSASFASYTTGDIIGMAFDSTTATVTFYKNGSLQGSLIYNSTNFTGTWKFGVASDGSGGTNYYNINFGRTPFMYSVPSGYKALNTKNLKDVGSYNLPDSFGNFVNTPDLVWLKGRNTATYPTLFDTSRGPGVRLFNSLTDGQSQDMNELSSFIPNGFTLGSNSDANASGSTYVSWNWNKDKTPGFDIVRYAGTGTAGAQIPHNLGAPPKMIIIKCESASATNWPVYHSAIGTLSNTTVLYLNTTDYLGNITGNMWNSTIPGSQYFTVGDTTQNNGAGKTYVAYCWSEVPGFSKFTSFTGNASTDGPFIYCGFRPKYVMVKKLTSADSWFAIDSVRNSYNGANNWFAIHTSNTEYSTSSGLFDFVSNGVKIRTSDAGPNAATTYLFTAFAESPFKYANAR